MNISTAKHSNDVIAYDKIRSLFHLPAPGRPIPVGYPLTRKVRVRMTTIAKTRYVSIANDHLSLKPLGISLAIGG